MAKTFQSDAQITVNEQIQGDYYRMLLHAPDIAAAASPGQFIHVQIPEMEHRVLRRYPEHVAASGSNPPGFVH